MRQMKVIKGFCEEDLINQYNDVVRELGDAIVNEETIGTLTMNIYYDDKKTPKLFGACKPEVKDGTCSACRHFSSMRGDGRYKYVKWGFCSVIQSNINEHHEYCPMHKRELGEEWKEVKVEQIKEPEVRKLYVG